MLAAPCAAITFNIPIIHIYGGSVTEGAIDDLVRHSLTKLSSFHLVATEKYKKRLIQLGEENWRIKNIGVPELQYLKKIKKMSKKEIQNKIGLNLNIKTFLVNFHSITTEVNRTKKYIKGLLSTVRHTKSQAIFTYPNADKGNEVIINEINKFIKIPKKKNISLLKMLEQNYMQTC